MRDRGVFLARVARIDAGAAGEVHVRGEADGDVGCDRPTAFIILDQCAMRTW